MEELEEQMNSSSLNKQFWVEEDFINMSKHLKYIFTSYGRNHRLTQQECEKIIMMCNISKCKKGDSLAKAYTFLNNQTGYIILFNYVKKWLPNPSPEQWSQICKLNSYYVDSVYFKIYS